ncbi:MAG: hypothetical protein WCE63_12225 [Acidobacteriaceae bacterium]
MNNNAADPQAKAVAELKKWVAANKQALVGQGIASITGEYSGEGDSGQLDLVYATSTNGEFTEYDVPHRVEQLFEVLSEELPPDGYENNDGGGGKITVELDSCIVTLEHYWRVTDTEYEEPKEF